MSLEFATKIPFHVWKAVVSEIISFLSLEIANCSYNIAKEHNSQSGKHENGNNVENKNSNINGKATTKNSSNEEKENHYC